MTLLRSIAATVCCFAVLSLAGLAGAAAIPLQIAPGSVGNDPTTWDDTFSYLSLIPVDDLSRLLLADDAGAESCFGGTSCTIALDPEWDYLAVKADGFVALFWLAPYQGSNTFDIDVTNWNFAPIGGNLWAEKWPNGGGGFPNITSVMAAHPNPEPASALLFGVGSLIVGNAVRRRARQSPGGD